MAFHATTYSKVIDTSTWSPLDINRVFDVINYVTYTSPATKVIYLFAPTNDTSNMFMSGISLGILKWLAI